MKTVKEFLKEGKKDYVIYHDTLTAAVTEVLAFVKKNGYTTNDEEFFDTVSTGPKKPSDGKTNRYTLSLYKGDKEQKKALHFQVYGIGSSKRTPAGRYELTAYIS